jgi:filamentous hemagglutinin
LNTRTGNAEVLAPDGQFYLETTNGLRPKAGGNLAELSEAERRIDGAKGIGEATLNFRRACGFNSY